MSDEIEIRATDEEMKRVKRYWDLPMIQLGPGAVSHLFASRNMTVSFIIQQPNCSFPVHSHEPEEIVIVLEGERDAVIDGRLYRIKAGDIISVPSGSRHGSHTYESGCTVIEVFSPPRLDLLARLEASQTK
ncbi:MAG: cupin domain-containing protein [Dehalococcoidia bacterium]|nr:cupin domain-containing protein [Dehalococcoidia bacterium]